MEHAQFYKMVAYEASTRVPVVMAGHPTPDPAFIHTQLLLSACLSSTPSPNTEWMAGPGIRHVGDGNVRTLTSLVDLLPTFLELAGAPAPQSTALVGIADPSAVDGTSLVPLLERGDAASGTHPDHVISQFHGENLAMSWSHTMRKTAQIGLKMAPM